MSRTHHDGSDLGVGVEEGLLEHLYECESVDLAMPS